MRLYNKKKSLAITLSRSTSFVAALWNRSTQRVQTSLPEADPTLPTVSCIKRCEAATWQQCYYALHCLGSDRLTPKILDHYLHHNLFMLQLLWCFFCSFTHHKRQTSPPNFSQFFIISPRTLPENFIHIIMSLMTSYNYMMTFSCHVTYVIYIM